MYLANIPVDKDVAAIKVPVNNTGFKCMQVIQTLKHLLGPFLQRPDRHMTVPLSVLSQVPRGADLSNEVQSIMLDIPPNMIQRDDIIVT